MLRHWRFLALAALYFLLGHVIPPPQGVTPAGWRITAVLISVIAGFILRPMPNAGVVILGLAATVVAGRVPMAKVLAGYASPTVWLMLIALLMSRAIIDTGLARRIALIFIRGFGQTSLGVAYALAFSEIMLAAGIPSVTARSGGIMVPIASSIAELYDSRPGATARRLGNFLMTSLYQTGAIACAMFITGQVSNVLAAKLAQQGAGVEVTAYSWFLAAVVPGLASALLVPWAVYRLQTPEITHTPTATQYAIDELKKLGPIRGREFLVLVIFVLVALLWLTSSLHGLDVTLVALMGLGVLLVSGVLDWATALKEHAAWDTFIWYGGVFSLSDLLNDTGSVKALARALSGVLRGLPTLGEPWLVALLVALLVFFYAHYAFASISAHLVALFPAFLVMLTALGTPAKLAVYSLACFANLTAGITHYGTTTGPIIYAKDYVGLTEWWRTGLIVSWINLGIWLTVGFAWWKFLGYW